MSLINNPLYKDDLLKVVEHTPDLKSLDGQSLLMIGASGMIGSFLVDTLMLANQYLGVNIKVYALGRNRQRLEERFSPYISDQNFEIIEGDVTDPLPFLLRLTISSTVQAIPIQKLMQPIQLERL